MKAKIILAAFIGILSFATISSGQGNWVWHVQISPSDASGDTVLVSYTGLEDRNPQILEAVIPALTPQACFASRDFSTAVPVGPDRASLTYDPETNTNSINFGVEKEYKASCRVLLVRSSTGADYAVWRANFGRRLSLAEIEREKYEAQAGNTRIKLPDVLVTSWQTSASDGGGIP